jgi:seryl-tRNA synthetase
MKKIILPCLLMVLILFTKDIQAGDDLTNKILQLEQNFSKLQQQINRLRKDMGSKKVSKTNSQRLANLEAYAVQLNDVLSEVKEQIEENTDEVARISKIQQTKPNIGVYGTITAAKAENQNSIIDGQSFELVISGQPHKRISYFTELEFERAATVGGSRGGEVLLEQAYTDFQVNSWLNFRGGILLVPFGNIERDHYAPLREVIS